MGKWGLSEIALVIDTRFQYIKFYICCSKSKSQLSSDGKVIQLNHRGFAKVKGVIMAKARKKRKTKKKRAVAEQAEETQQMSESATAED